MHPFMAIDAMSDQQPQEEDGWSLASAQLDGLPRQAAKMQL